MKINKRQLKNTLVANQPEVVSKQQGRYSTKRVKSWQKVHSPKRVLNDDKYDQGGTVQYNYPHHNDTVWTKYRLRKF